MREDRGLGLDVDAHVPARFLERVAVGVREQHDGLFRVIDAIGGQARLVVEDERDAIDAGNVSGGHDHDVRPGDARLELDALDETARNGASDRGPKKHPRQREVVDVLRPASDLGRTFAAGDRAADEGHVAWPNREQEIRRSRAIFVKPKKLLSLLDSCNR